MVQRLRKKFQRSLEEFRQFQTSTGKSKKLQVTSTKKR